MHHYMQQRADGLAALRARSLMATAEFYELIGRPAPEPEPLFQAVAKGKAWHIIEIATGKTKGFCFSYKAAMIFVDAMEACAVQEKLPVIRKRKPHNMQARLSAPARFWPQLIMSP